MGCTTSSCNDTVIVKRFYAEPHFYSNFKNAKSSMRGDAVAEMVKRRMTRKSSNVNTILVGYLKTCSAYSRPKPNESDFKFIEQRIVHDCESRATESTYIESGQTTLTSTSPAESNKNYCTPSNDRLPTSFLPTAKVDVFAGAYNYRKRLQDLKDSATEVAKEMKHENPIAEEVSPRPQIIAHCLEADFHGGSNNASPKMSAFNQPILETHPIAALRKKDDFDTSSENSFVVVHSTVKVAWERETYRKLAEEAKKNGHFNLKPAMAELHVIGQIQKGSDFPDARLFVRWNMHTGGGWKVVQGEIEGQTQTDLSGLADAYFSHPLEFHLSTKTVQGWPRINLQIWHYDEYGRQELYGYGTVFVPTAPGEHTINCYTWRAKGGFSDELTHRFLGGGLQLQTLSTLDAPEDRMRLQTQAMGTVQLQISVITRNFEKFGIIS
ncbi:hypothetical protein QR680_003470 [Steinernema hermaphroditum]|uniref:B9 domain-containing protein 2 n=1 Tax=Steinernema hermaphroditum TaxID=289476 RepID=A0AA39LK78_9BILA|nr:hypothetical protein QR680_003470 [Steinernema hermaphroditum]